MVSVQQQSDDYFAPVVARLRFGALAGTALGFVIGAGIEITTFVAAPAPIKGDPDCTYYVVNILLWAGLGSILGLVFGSVFGVVAGSVESSLSKRCSGPRLPSVASSIEVAEGRGH